MFLPSLLVLSQGWGLIDLLLRASNEGSPRPRVARAQKISRLHPLPLLTIRSSKDYSFPMELPDLKDDPYLNLLRPLVEAYLAFELINSRHIKSLRLTPSQFDVIATLGDTDGFTCSELSAHTLVTKGTLTGVLDRLVAKGLIRRDSVKGDRRRIKIRLTEKGNTMFRHTFAAHIAFIKPFFERALNQKEVDIARTLLLRLRDSFRKEVET
jgi:DNA-binding MarR family transcriptional regulator